MEILQKGNPILNKKALEVKPDDISSTQIQDLIKEMKEILSKKNEGAALAAPQVGKSVRLFIIAGSVFGEEEDSNTVFINPKIIEQSEEKEWMEEGCLSVEGIYGKVNRSTSCTIRAYDLQGEIFTQKGHGLISQIFQHEVDHLNGILFIEKAKDLFQVDDENQNKKL